MTLFRDETFGPVVAVVALHRRGRGRRARQRLRLRAQLHRSGRATRARGRELAHAAARRHGERQRGLRRGVGLGRRADGRDEGLRASAAATARDGILKYTEAQTVAVQRLLPIAPPPGVPQGLWGRVMTLSLRLLRRAARACAEPMGGAGPRATARARRRREPRGARAGRRRAGGARPRGDRARRRARGDGAGDPRAPARPRHRRAARGQRARARADPRDRRRGDVPGVPAGRRPEPRVPLDRRTPRRVRPPRLDRSHRAAGRHRHRRRALPPVPQPARRLRPPREDRAGEGAADGAPRDLRGRGVRASQASGKRPQAPPSRVSSTTCSGNEPQHRPNPRRATLSSHPGRSGHRAP